MHKKLKYTLTAVCVLFLPITAHGFDTKTHVFVGQQVLNDLNRQGVEWGKVNIPPFGDFEVNAEVRDAILNNQSVYLMGNVGPDGYPDLIGGQQTTHPGGVHGDPNGWKTDDWMKYVLKRAQESKIQKNIAFAYGYLGHGAGDFWAHTYVNWYSGDQFELFDSDRVDNETRHSALEKYIAKHQPTLPQGDVSSIVARGESLPLDFLYKTFISNDDVNTEYAKIGATTHLWAMYQMEKKLVQMEDDANDSAIWDIQNAQSEIYTYFYSEAAGLVTLASAEVAGLLAELVDECSDWEWALNWSTCALIEASNDLVYDELKAAEATLRAAQDDVKNVTAAVLSYQKHIKLWRESVQEANRAYIKASSKMSQEFLKVSGGDALPHLKNWALCYGAVYASLYQPLNQVACEAIGLTADSINKLEQAINAFVDFGKEYDELLLILNPSAYGVYKAAEYVHDKIQQLKDYAKQQLVQRFVDEEVYDYLNILKGKVGDAELKAAFQLTGYNKGLIEISDIVTRVQSDMHLDGNGKFDPSKFNLVKNAIIMAKLTLLDADGLNELVTRAGVDSFPVYGTYPLFFDEQGFSIFSKAVRSIDGNHAWMPVAPPNPRSEGYLDSSPEEERHFGYYFQEEGIDPIGFKLWKEPKVREKVFLKIFSGPIAPALEAPQSVGLSRVIPGSYTDYVACNSNPYPSEIGDLRCYSEWLVPIISGLLLN